MTGLSTFLVLGATGGTGRHFTEIALADGHIVRALIRSPGKALAQGANLEVRPGSITDPLDMDELVADVDFVVAMLGDKQTQRHTMICDAFVRRLIPAMRRQRVRRFLYQAGGLSCPYGKRLPLGLWVLRQTVARSYLGQHRDNEAVMAYLTQDAADIEWIVHRAAIGSDGLSRGVLRRSTDKLSIATFRDCAAYNYRILTNKGAIHSSDLSRYA